MDERDLHLWGNLIINFEASIQPLIRLIVPIVRGLHGHQEEWLGVGQVFYSRIGEFHVPEEV